MNILAHPINPLLSQIQSKPSRAAKDLNSRIALFCQWQASRGEHWYEPDLEAWRNMLLEGGKRPSTVSAYLATIRGAYRRVLRDNATRSLLYGMAPADASPADKKAFVDEVLVRIQNAIHPDTAPVKQTTVQDRADSAALRLTPMQAEQLVHAPDITTLSGLRDAAVIAMLLCTGIREDELCRLEIDDLRQTLGGELALLVRHGKGDKQRLVPYGELDWCLVLVDAWLQEAGITSGAVFRGVYKAERNVRDVPLTPRSVQRILARYPIVIAGQLTTVKPHDCRRTYARLMYDAGVDLIAIQQNLGHAATDTTLGYIGTLDADKRRGKGVIRYNLAQLYRRG
nr:tyrosine-type recombinase/integrase [Anaerolineae bacterium]